MTLFRENEHPWVQSMDFQDVQVLELLDLIADAEPDPAQPPAWVFDLDSTLFCTSGRNKRAFEKFLSSAKSPPSHWSLLFSELSPKVQEYGIPKTFYKILVDNGWESSEAKAEARAIWEEYQDHWLQDFFSSENMSLDEAYEGAASFVQQVQAKGREIVYLTGRDSPRALEGTIEALKKNDFPLGKGTHLRLKPSSEMGDAEFKDMACQRIAQEFNAELFVDNEAENLEIFAKRFPNAEIVFFHSIMSPRAPSEKMDEYLAGRRVKRLLSYQ